MVAMSKPKLSQRRLERLRDQRNVPERDLSLGFLKKQFKQEVERPYKQLGDLAAIWEQLVPVELARHTRLDSLSRGVLRVSVGTSSHLYKLDRLLRSGLERELISQNTGKAIRRVQLRVDAQTNF